jgi:hypothetical protein
MKPYINKAHGDRESSGVSWLRACAVRVAQSLRTWLALIVVAAAGNCAANEIRYVIANVPRFMPFSIPNLNLEPDRPFYVIVLPPSHGTLDRMTGFDDSLPTYTPDPDFVGGDEFRYVIRDGFMTSQPHVILPVVRSGLSVSDISVIEGASGTRAATFTVSLTAPGTATNPIAFNYKTVDGTGNAGTDYVAASGRITVAPGVRSQPITIQVIGDSLLEFSETFVIELSNTTPNATILTGGGTARAVIVNDDGSPSGTGSRVGSAALSPADTIVRPGEPMMLSLDWTHPERWRLLDSIDLVIVDDEDAILSVRWHETTNSFSLFNFDADRFVRTARAGSPAHFESFAAMMYLDESTGGGPPGQTVTVDYGLIFKPQAAGRTFRVEASAANDDGIEQAFEQVGTITLLPH